MRASLARVLSPRLPKAGATVIISVPTVTAIVGGAETASPKGVPVIMLVRDSGGAGALTTPMYGPEWRRSRNAANVAEEDEKLLLPLLLLLLLTLPRLFDGEDS